jgi:hypothetical protein
MYGPTCNLKSPIVQYWCEKKSVSVTVIKKIYGHIIVNVAYVLVSDCDVQSDSPCTPLLITKKPYPLTIIVIWVVTHHHYFTLPSSPVHVTRLQSIAERKYQSAPYSSFTTTQPNRKEYGFAFVITTNHKPRLK